MNSSSAFIIYRWKRKGGKQPVSFNDETKAILFPQVPAGEKVSIPKIASLCIKWKGILDQRQKEINGSAVKGDHGKGYIDFLQSWRRKYAVRGVLLSERTPVSGDNKEKNYLFIIERFKPETINLTGTFRQWKLNHREQEIVRLIIEDYGNKEIAKQLGISINTVKAYMKLLLRKVGVHTRAGLVSALMTGKVEE